MSDAFPAASSDRATARSQARAWLIERLYRFGIFDRLRRRNRSRVTVLQYHGVTVSSHGKLLNFRRKHVEAAEFERQMVWLRARYEVVPMTRVVAHVTKGVPLPDHCAAVTFDDGFRNNYSVAFPVLSALSLPATIFVPTDFVSGKGPLWLDRIEYALNSTRLRALTLDVPGTTVHLPLESARDRVAGKKLLKDLLMQARPDLVPGVVEQVEARAGAALGGTRAAQGDYAPLSWDELAQMDRSHLIGVESHTVTHAILPRCPPAELAYELTQSKTVIEETIGRPCTVFSYPNGAFDTSTQAAVAAAGYAGAVCSLRGFNHPRTDALAIRRFGVIGTIPLSEFAALVTGGLAFLTNARSLARRA